MDNISKFERKNTWIVNLLVCSFVCWPFVWSLWSFLRIPVELLGAHFATILIFIIAAVSLLSSPLKLKKSMLPWLVFYLVTLLEIGNANMQVYLKDIGISLSAWIICATVGQRNYDRAKAVKCIRVIGMIVAVSVILEYSIHLFSGVLKPLFTSKALEVRNNSFGGGLFPYSSYAGCFLVPGLAALVIQQQNRRKSPRFYIETVIYVLSLIMIRKRGFILDIVVGVLFLLCLDIRRPGKKIVLRKNKAFITLISIVASLLLVFVLYSYVPFIRTATDSLLTKFYEEDGDFSGRDRLYELALSIFRNNMLTGIGWGQFRALSEGIFSYASKKTYEVHNVYLQLLCENGIVGLVSFLLATGSVLIYTSRKYLRLAAEGKEAAERRAMVKLAVFMQIFFLAYCISGNPLYDYNFAVTYFIGVLLAFA